MALTEKQMTAAQDAWERTARDWKIIEARDYSPDGFPTWLLTYRPEFISPPATHGEMAMEVSNYRFNGKFGEQSARFLKREKIIEAIAAAIEAAAQQ